MHSHHSHSGDYISHGSGSLEDMVATARAKGFKQYCLTEHMPRLEEKFLYPEETVKNYTTLDLDSDFQRFLDHARALQAQESPTKLLVGFEVEGIDEPHIEAAKKYKALTDMCVGSVHYVHGIPIDFDAELWEKARNVSGSTRALYRDYFELQYKVLTGVHPDVVGHFDLIRLFDASADDVDLQQDWPEVHELITRNIEYVVSYGGLFELNSSAIRKGWLTPYPRTDIAKTIMRLGGRFCLSDDAHTPAQVGLNYHKVWLYMKDLGLEHVYYLNREAGQTVVAQMALASVQPGLL